MKKALIGIKTPFKENQYPKNAEMTEQSLIDVVKIFFNISRDNEIITNKMLPEFKEKKEYFNYHAFRPDITLPEYRLVFEYDGYMHYQHPFDIEKDRIKMQILEELGYKRIRWPYFFQLTKEVAYFIFNNLVSHFSKNELNLYSDEKFFKAIKKVYVNPINKKPLSEEDYNNGYLFAPGFHTTKQVPSTFHKKGIKRFLDDMTWKCNKIKYGCKCNGQTPDQLKHQVIKSLNLYIRDVETDLKTKESRNYLILPEDSKEFLNFYKSIEVNEDYCKFYYPREIKN